MKLWIGLIFLAFVTIFLGQWISGMIIMYMYEQGNERTTFTIFYWLIQSLVTGSVFWLVLWRYLKKKGVFI